MSHFTVLVIGEDVDDQLAPFHEFECTGINDQYIKDVDLTDEAWTEFCQQIDAVVREDADHEWVSRFSDVCYREPTLAETAKIGPIAGTGGDGEGLSWVSHDWRDGRGYRTQIYEVPAGWEEANLPASERRSFLEFCEAHYGHEPVPHNEEPDLDGRHKFGYTIIDEAGAVTRTVDRTNPDAHWDWYLIGGRWSGFFLLRDGAEGEVGEPGLSTELAGRGRADSALKGDVDLETMRVQAGAKAGTSWDGLHRVIADRTFIPWTEYLAEVDAGRQTFEEARGGYNEQPAIKDVNAWTYEEKMFLPADSPVWTDTRKDHVQRARDHALSVHAVVKDGTWHERGSMGFFAMVSDKVDPAEWEARFTELLDSLPDATRLTIVDCHI